MTGDPLFIDGVDLVDIGIPLGDAVELLMLFGPQWQWMRSTPAASGSPQPAHAHAQPIQRACALRGVPS